MDISITCWQIVSISSKFIFPSTVQNPVFTAKDVVSRLINKAVLAVIDLYVTQAESTGERLPIARTK